MDCRYFDEYASPYLDEMLDGQDKERFEKHLSQCPECKKNFEETRKIISMLNHFDEEPLPQGFNDNLYKKLEERRKPKALYWLRWVGAVASVIVILFSIKAIRNAGLMDMMTEDASPAQEIAEDRGSTSDMGAQNNLDKDATGSESSVAIMEDNGEVDNDSYTEIGQDDMADGDSVDKASKEEVYTSNARGIQSDVVEVYVQDICITPQTLKFMAINNELELVESDENSVVIELIDDEQRNILYSELSKMGEIKEVGQNTEGSKVKIIIKNMDSQE